MNNLCGVQVYIWIILAQTALINSLQPDCLISAVCHAAVSRCLHVPSHAHFMCNDWLCHSNMTELTAFVYHPLFLSILQSLQLKEREEAMRVGEKKKRALCFWHTQHCRSVASLYWEVQDRHFVSPELQPKRLRANVCISSIAVLISCKAHS